MAHAVTFLRTIAALLFAAGAALTGRSALGAASLEDYLGKTKAEIAATLESEGYVVEEFDIEGGVIEVEATIDGIRYEIHIDPETGKIVHIEEDD